MSSKLFLILLALIGYGSYKFGFIEGAESEKGFVSYAKYKLNQCNEVVARNCPEVSIEK